MAMLSDGQLVGQCTQWLNRIGRGNDKFWYESKEYRRCNHLQYFVLRLNKELLWLEKELQKQIDMKDVKPMTREKYVRAFKVSINTGNGLISQLLYALKQVE